MRKGHASRTAKMMAFWRSLADMGITTVPGFSDPGARKLLRGRFWRYMLARAEEKARAPGDPAAAGMRSWIDGLILRVVFIDAVIAEAAPRQVVILGAGLDTRAYRLTALRGARVFEVDHPSTQAYKREQAAELGPPLAELTYVPVDFTRDDLAAELQAAGFEPSLPTVWVWEGVIMYLDDAALRSTLAAVKRLSAPGSTLIAHYHEPGQVTSGGVALVRKLVFSWIGEPQIGLRSRQVMQDEVTRAGFQINEDAGLAEQASRVGARAPAKLRLEVSHILVAKVE